jgi:SAM-dependent methyltransferase
VSHALSRVKYWASRPLPPKAYWYLMGRFKAVPAVTSDYVDVEDCLASGQQVVDLLDRLGVLHPGAVTLHIGCGIGRVEHHLRHRVRRCVGVDVSPSMVKRARALVPYENVEFHCTNGTDLSAMADGTVDLVYSFLVFQHLPRPQFRRYVAEAHSKLSEGGRFVFQMMIDETGTAPEPPPSHPYGLRHYTRRQVEDALAAAGFFDVSRTDLHGRADDGSLVTGDVVFSAARRTTAARPVGPEGRRG